MGFDVTAARERWNAAAGAEEAWASEPSVNRSLRWREIEKRLTGVHTILDVGAGTGAFSIPLARRGFHVTHFDLSPAMLEIARHKAKTISNIEFVEGNAADLSRFSAHAFDLVLNMDGAVSGSGEDAEKVIAETCRVTSRLAVFSMAHAAFTIPRVLKNDESVGELRTFTSREVRGILEAQGMIVTRAGGIGSLARLCGADFVKPLLGDRTRFEAFIDRCERFDYDVLPDGPGTEDDTGLFAVAVRG